jgi:hypothetical protein
VTVTLHPQIRIDHDLSELSDRLGSAVAREIRALAPDRLPVDADRPLEAAVRVDVSEDLGRLVVHEQLRLRHDRTWPLEVQQRREVPIGPAGIDLAATLAGGLGAALGVLAEMVDLFRRADDDVRAVVRNPERPADLRALAVRILQERRARAAVDDVIGAFRDAPPALRLTIIDALAAWGPPDDLRRLLPQVDARRVDEISHALRAAAMIGGREAREYAAWMATGHPDERVRDTALEAYRQITETLPPEEVLQLGYAGPP